MVVLFAGVFGTLFFIQNQTHAAFADPAATCAGVTQIPVAECIVLLNLYNSTNGDNRTNKTNRGNISNICSAPRYWITCTYNWTPKHIEGINLVGNNLSWSLPSLLWLSSLYLLYLQNNQIESISDNAFSGLNNIQYLEINNNHLTTIPINAFAGLWKLFYLALNDNQITAIPNLGFGLNSDINSIDLQNNQIESISDNTFDGLSNLRALHLSNNQLTTISRYSLGELNNLQRLTLDNNLINSISDNAFVGIPKLYSLTLNNNQLNILWTDTFIWLSNLHELTLDNNILTTIPDNTFNSLSNLWWITLNNNKLVTLPEGIITLPNMSDPFFYDPSRYYSLALDNNCINTWLISSTLFNFAIQKAGTNWQTTQNNCPSLFWLLNINNNNDTTNISNVSLNIYTIPNTNKMRFSNDWSIWSNREQYSTTKERTLSAWGWIKTVYVQFDTNNDASSDFETSDTIHYINISDTTSTCADVTQIPINECIDLLNLYNGTDGNNRTNKTNRGNISNICSAPRYGITCTDTGNPKHIQRIDLQGNNLSGSISSLTNLSSLDSIYLSNNQLSDIVSNAFIGLVNLNYIYINNNQLTNISSFANLSNLYALYLDNNQLTSIPSNAFAGLSNIQDITLNNNKLTTISSNTFNWLSTLSYLTLNDNRLTTLPENLSTLTTITAYYNDPAYGGDWTRYYNLFLDNNCIDTWTLSTNLFDFTIQKAGTDRQSTQNNCPISSTPLIINNNSASTTSNQVTLTMAISPAPTQMRFSDDWITRSDREAYATSKVRTLPGTYGSKTIYAMFDNSMSTSQTILYTAPAWGGTECAAWSYCGDLTLKILSWSFGCEYGRSLDFGTTGLSYSARSLSTGFLTNVGNIPRSCEDNQGIGSRALSIQSTDLINLSTNISAQTIPASSVFVKNPGAYTSKGACTYYSWDSLNGRVDISSPVAILGKIGEVGEGCKIITDNVSLRVDLTAAQAIGQYSGTLYINLPNF